MDPMKYCMNYYRGIVRFFPHVTMGSSGVGNLKNYSWNLVEAIYIVEEPHQSSHDTERKTKKTRERGPNLQSLLEVGGKKLTPEKGCVVEETLWKG